MPIVQNLIVEEFGSFIGKHSERLVVTKGEETLIQAPLLHLESVLITGYGVSISADAVKECAERGIPIHFVSGTGNAYASLYSAGLTGTILTRRAQLEAYNTIKGLVLALALARGKIQNQANLLKYMGKYRKETAPDLFDLLRRRAEMIEQHAEQVVCIQNEPEVKSSKRATIDGWRSQIMGIEGRAAEMYWDTVRQIFPSEYEWRGREGRGARDPINSALNYGYGILYGQVERALVLAGLDPYAGFAHVDRPGKPSMTLDMIEEFRQPVVDRTIFGLVNKNVKIEQDERGYLVEDTRKMLAEKVLNRLETAEAYPYGTVPGKKKNVPLRIIMQTQARHVATFLRGERSEYTAFVMEWQLGAKMQCVVVYDISDDNKRIKIADACLDYGLDRIQFSAFLGDLAPTHQDELMLRVQSILGKKPGNVQLFPICEKDWNARRIFENKAPDDVETSRRSVSTEETDDACAD